MYDLTLAKVNIEKASRKLVILRERLIGVGLAKLANDVRDIITDIHDAEREVKGAHDHARTDQFGRGGIPSSNSPSDPPTQSQSE